MLFTVTYHLSLHCQSWTTSDENFTTSLTHAYFQHHKLKHMLTQPTRPECNSLRQCPSHNQYSMPSVGSYISRCRSGHLSISVFCSSSFFSRESLYLCCFDSFRSLYCRFWWNSWHVKSKHKYDFEIEDRNSYYFGTALPFSSGNF